MKRRPSMTRKIVVTVSGIVAASWLLAVGFGMMIMQDEFAEIFDSGVQETAERLLPIVVDDLLAKTRQDIPRRLAGTSASQKEYLTYQVRTSTGAVILHSHDAPPEPFASPLKIGFFDTATHRIYTAGTVDGSLYLQVADSLEHRREAAIEGGVALLLPLLVLLPASIVAMLLVVRATLGPIKNLQDDIGSKDGGDLEPVREERLPKELHSIAHSVNLLLERLRAVLEAEREFTANSAHELRTPIAGALAQIQRLIAQIPSNLLPGARQVEGSLQHLARLAEKLLQMSRAEAGIGVTERPSDLLAILDLIIEDLDRTITAAGRIKLHAGGGVRLVRAIDPDAFAIVIRNLLENALIHSPAGSTVNIYVENDARIRVANHGPVIDNILLQGLTVRFARGATTASGSGLGLSIVRCLVEQMNGTLLLASPATGMDDGFEVIVQL